MTHTTYVTDVTPVVELVGTWSKSDIAYASGKHGVSNDYADKFAGFAIQSLPETDLTLKTTQRAMWCKMDTQKAMIDNGPIVTKDGVRRGNNSLAMQSIGRVSRHNAQRPKMISHSKILLDKASAKIERSLAIPEQVGAMIKKAADLQVSIERKLAKGHDASNLIGCLSVLQARVRFMLDHCEDKGLLEIHPMKTGKAIGSLGKGGVK